MRLWPALFADTTRVPAPLHREEFETLIKEPKQPWIERRYQSRLAPGGEDLGTNGARETERR